MKMAQLISVNAMVSLYTFRAIGAVGEVDIVGAVGDVTGAVCW